VLLLVFAATVLSVAFATRAAIATNRPVIEVLHLIGANDSFIAAHFQRHFLQLGLKGGLIGGGSAIALFVLAELASGSFVGTAGGEQLAGLVWAGGGARSLRLCAASRRWGCWATGRCWRKSD